jgi:glucose/arabinose dehydrogenase
MQPRLKFLLVGALTLLGSGLAPMTSRADVALSPVGGAFDHPVLVTAPPGDTHRQFVLEQGGSIRLVVDGMLQAEPFLAVPHGAGEGQQVLSLAFAPDYATSGLLYVYEHRWDNGPVNVRVRVQEFSRSTGDPNRADPASQRTVLTTTDDMPFSYHVGGHLAFGSDGLLYVSIGDGDDFGNPDNSAQRLDSLRGKLLRVDPGASQSLPYTVPAGNPYPALDAPFDLIYARGLRNPWRFAFDAGGGILIGDPGESRREEIDYSAPGSLSGANFGWNCFEGTLVFAAANTCPGAVPPVHEYEPTGPAGCGAAVIGGLVVRDAGLPELEGRYLYGDYCTGALRSFLLCDGAAIDDRPVAPAVPSVTSFGEDGQHHVYVTVQPGNGAGSAARLISSVPDDPRPGCPSNTAPTSTKDVVAPRVSGLALGTRAFRAASKGGSIARKRTPVGTRVRFRLSEAATARFTIDRAARGRKKGRRCVAPKKAKRKARGCRRYVRMKGGFSRHSKAGPNSFRFTGRLRGRKLRPGRYRLVLVSRDAAGNKSAAKRAKFRVVIG